MKIQGTAFGWPGRVWRLPRQKDCWQLPLFPALGLVPAAGSDSVAAGWGPAAAGNDWHCEANKRIYR